MAIVKTTTRDFGNGAGDETPTTQPLDRTKSVIAQGNVRPASRSARQPGMVVRSRSESLQQPKPGDLVEETMAELKKVTWPTPQERVSGTIVTLGMLIFFAVYILGLDSLAKTLFEALHILPPGSK